MHCTICGNYISDDNARFCDNCGSALPAGNTEFYGPDNGSYPAVSSGPDMPPMQPNKNNNRILIPVIAAVMVFIAGLAVFLVTGPFKDKADSGQKEETETSSEQKDDYQHVIPDDSEEDDYSLTTDSYLTDNASRSEYLFPSDTERLTYNILDKYSQEQIRLIANEIYARHGYIFTDEYLNSYFSMQSWYRPRISSMEEVSLYFSDLEEANLITISNYREYKGWANSSNGSVTEEKPSDYGSSDYNDSDFLFPTDKKLLTFEDLSNFTRAEIDLMANEPYARHGLDFRAVNKYDLYKHFSQFTWYNPHIKSYDDMPKYFTKIEDTNLSIINRYRERMGWKKNSDPKPNSALAGIVYNEDDFIFPTNDELLTFDILSRYTEAEIRLIANEPYARHGMDFSKIGKDDLYEYFSKFSWYTPCVDTTNEVSKYFTKLEDTNLSIINRYREHMGWK